MKKLQDCTDIDQEFPLNLKNDLNHGSFLS